MSDFERRDLYGRTESELRSAIALAERLLEIQKAWRGNDRLGAEVGTAIKHIEIDRRQLAIMLGEMRDNRPPFPEAARQKMYREIASLDRGSGRR